jgi:hypothetical protein
MVFRRRAVADLGKQVSVLWRHQDFKPECFCCQKYHGSSYYIGVCGQLYAQAALSAAKQTSVSIEHGSRTDLNGVVPEGKVIYFL